ncbi:MAG TPA: glycosyltransferase, partial [Thermoanaerobaculia bacterium]
CRFTIELHRANGFATDDWYHVPWGVDYRLFPARLKAPGKERVVVGFAGTLLGHKGAHVLVEAVAKRPDLDVELRLWGESFHEDNYGRRLRELAGDDPRISFRGRYSHDEFSDLLSGLDALAIPSLWHENLPTTGLNAVAAGVPLLVSDVGGLAELVSDYACGFTFPTGNPDALADLLLELSHDRRRLEAVRASIVDPPPLEEEAWRVEQIYRCAVRR